MKPPQVPKEYIESHCQRNDIIACDYLLNSIGCPRTCAYAEEYHPINRALTLREQGELMAQDRRDLT